MEFEVVPFESLSPLVLSSGMYMNIVCALMASLHSMDCSTSDLYCSDSANMKSDVISVRIVARGAVTVRRVVGSKNSQLVGFALYEEGRVLPVDTSHIYIYI